MCTLEASTWSRLPGLLFTLTSMAPQVLSLSRRAGPSIKPNINDFDALWENALLRYTVETGKDLLELLAEQDFPSILSDTDEVIAYFETQNASFKAFRTSGKRIRGILKPIVSVVLFLVEGAQGASVSRPCSNLVDKTPL